MEATIRAISMPPKNFESTLDEDSALVDLQSELNLFSFPRVIECFDISNLGQEHVVSGMVRFTDAKPDKSNYRKLRIKIFIGQDDFAAINEVVRRRYKRLTEENAQLPDMVIVDGGSWQVTAAQSALKMLRLQLLVIGLAKEHEDIFLPGESTPHVSTRTVA